MSYTLTTARWYDRNNKNMVNRFTGVTILFIQSAGIFAMDLYFMSFVLGAYHQGSHMYTIVSYPVLSTHLPMTSSAVTNPPKTAQTTATQRNRSICNIITWLSFILLELWARVNLTVWIGVYRDQGTMNIELTSFQDIHIVEENDWDQWFISGLISTFNKISY